MNNLDSLHAFVHGSGDHEHCRGLMKEGFQIVSLDKTIIRSRGTIHSTWIAFVRTRHVQNPLIKIIIDSVCDRGCHNQCP